MLYFPQLLLGRFWPDPVADRWFKRDNMDALDRAGWYAKVAARALIANYGMHLLGGTHDGVNRAGLYTQCTTNANLFINDHDRFF